MRIVPIELGIKLTNEVWTNMRSMTVSYSKQTYDSPNPIARFSHRARLAKSLAIAKQYIVGESTAVDFGAGDGTFLHQLGIACPQANLLAIEPYMTLKYGHITRLKNIWELEPSSVSFISGLEVAEHLSDYDLEDFLQGARRALNPTGRLLITVPIMYGLSLPLKEMSRMLVHRKLGDTGLADLIRASTGRPILRTDDRNKSHKGFDFRCFRYELSKQFAIKSEFFSPITGLPWWMNSQAFFLARQINI